MFTSLILAAAVSAAPVPKDAGPPGPPPRVLDLAADPDGKVRVQVYRTETIKVPIQGINNPANANPPPQQIREQTIRRSMRVELSEVKELTLFTADGKEADKAVLKKLATEGGVVVVSTDGKKVDPKYLKLFRDDVLILAAPELTATTSTVTRTTGLALPPAALQQQLQLRAIPAQVLPVVPPPAVPPPPPDKK